MSKYLSLTLTDGMAALLCNCCYLVFPPILASHKMYTKFFLQYWELTDKSIFNYFPPE